MTFNNETIMCEYYEKWALIKKHGENFLIVCHICWNIEESAVY